MDKICYPPELLAFPYKKEILHTARILYRTDELMYIIFLFDRTRSWVIPVFYTIFLPNLGLAVYIRDIHRILMLIAQGILIALLYWGIRRAVFGGLHVFFKHKKLELAALAEKGLTIALKEHNDVTLSFEYLANFLMNQATESILEYSYIDHDRVVMKFRKTVVLYALKKAYVGIFGDKSEEGANE